MWANAQRDDHPAEYRWCALCSTPQFGWRPLLECHAVTLPRREMCWNLLWCPKLTNRSQPLVGQSLPYCANMWRKYCCLKMICNDFLVVKLNCWSYAFNIMKYMWILRNVKNKNIVEKKTYESVHGWFASNDIIPGKHNQTMNQTAYWVLNVNNRSRNNT